MQDRDQKHQSLELAVRSRWFPQLEVDVTPERAVASKAPLVTDLDVFASIPDYFNTYRTAVFDCKTKAKESPVNRCLWLSGVMQRVRAEQGFCILRKRGIEVDHRLMATKLGIVLLEEREFATYANATCPRPPVSDSKTADMAVWETFFAIPKKFPKLAPSLAYLRSTYWMVDDAAEACRKTLSMLRETHPEFDPQKSEHLALFFDFCALFARSLAVVVSRLFRAYLQPAKQVDLSEALLLMLYGGRDAYDHRNSLFRLVKSSSTQDDVSDLSLPEWDGFLQLVRQLLDAPMESHGCPLLLREVGFTFLSGTAEFSFARTLCSESLHAAKFAMLIANYLCKAAQLPPEFGLAADGVILSLIDVK